MTSRRGLIAGIAGSTLAAAGAGWWWRHRPPAAIRIGVGQPLSGPLAPLGQDLLRGAQMAVDDLNRQSGGVRMNGYSIPLAIVSADDKADESAGKDAARRLVAADPIVVIAHLNSGVSIATAPIYAAAGIPQLAISTKPEYTRLGLPTTLRLVANDDQQSRALGALASQLPDVHRMAVVDDGTPYGKGLADSAARVLAAKGREPAWRQSFDNRTTRFGDLVARMARDGLDTLVTTLSDFQVLAFAGQAVAAGLRDLVIVGGDTIKTDALRQQPTGEKEVYATSSIVEPKEFGASGQAFVARYRALYRGEPVYGAHYAYDAVCYVADALGRVGALDRARLLQVLKTVDCSCPVTNELRFGLDGEQRYAAVAAYHLRGGQWDLMMRSDRW